MSRKNKIRSIIKVTNLFTFDKLLSDADYAIFCKESFIDYENFPPLFLKEKENNSINIELKNSSRSIYAIILNHKSKRHACFSRIKFSQKVK